MYLDWFKLNEAPFRLSPDPSFLYLSKQHARAKAYMESTVWFSDGFVVITGEIGSGKTTLIESFVAELDNDVEVAKVSQTQVSPVQFLQAVLADFGYRPFKKRKAELLDMLNYHLVEQYSEGRKVLLIIDEAQNLTNRALEEVRLLSGVEQHKEKCLRMILAGQPELSDTLNLPEMRQLAQRVRLRLHLSPLTKTETRAYIRHRLEVAGGQGHRLFEPGTDSLVFNYTGGTPRLINTLCDTALLMAFEHQQETVSEELLNKAIAELQWDEPSALTNRGSAISDSDNQVEPAPVARLLIAHEGKQTDEFPLTPGRLIIGRTSDNDLQINSKYISRHHAQIITNDDQSVLEDLNSTNGIYVRSKRVKKHSLRDGDVVVIGKHELMYVNERVGPK